MPQTDRSEIFVAACEAAGMGLLLFLALLILTQYVLKGGSQYMTQWMRQLALILHAPLWGMIIPANVAEFYGSILPFVMFDVLPPQYSTELVFELSEEHDKKFFLPVELDQIENVGYDSSNAMKVLGSIYIFTSLYIIKALWWCLVIKPCTYTPLKPEFQIKAKDMGDNLFFGPIHTLMMEPIFEWTIAGYLSYKYGNKETSGDVVGLYVGWFANFMVWVFLPLSCIWFMASDFKKMSDQRKKTFRTLIEGVRTKSKAQLAFSSWYLVRRLSYVIFAYNLRDIPAVGLVIFQYFNLFGLIYQAHVKPLDGIFKNRLELTNECFLQLVTWHLLGFTDWLPFKA